MNTPGIPPSKIDPSLHDEPTNPQEEDAHPQEPEPGASSSFSLAATPPPAKPVEPPRAIVNMEAFEVPRYAYYKYPVINQLRKMKEFRDKPDDYIETIAQTIILRWNLQLIKSHPNTSLHHFLDSEKGRQRLIPPAKFIKRETISLLTMNEELTRPQIFTKDRLKSEVERVSKLDDPQISYYLSELAPFAFEPSFFDWHDLQFHLPPLFIELFAREYAPLKIKELEYAWDRMPPKRRGALGRIESGNKYPDLFIELMIELMISEKEGFPIDHILEGDEKLLVNQISYEGWSELTKTAAQYLTKTYPELLRHKNVFMGLISRLARDGGEVLNHLQRSVAPSVPVMTSMKTIAGEWQKQYGNLHWSDVLKVYNKLYAELSETVKIYLEKSPLYVEQYIVHHLVDEMRMEIKNGGSSTSDQIVDTFSQLYMDKDFREKITSDAEIHNTVYGRKAPYPLIQITQSDDMELLESISSHLNAVSDKVSDKPLDFLKVAYGINVALGSSWATEGRIDQLTNYAIHLAIKEWDSLPYEHRRFFLIRTLKPMISTADQLPPLFVDVFIERVLQQRIAFLKGVWVQLPNKLAQSFGEPLSSDRYPQRFIDFMLTVTDVADVNEIITQAREYLEKQNGGTQGGTPTAAEGGQGAGGSQPVGGGSSLGSSGLASTYYDEEIIATDNAVPEDAVPGGNNAIGAGFGVYMGAVKTMRWAIPALPH